MLTFGRFSNIKFLENIKHSIIRKRLLFLFAETTQHVFWQKPQEPFVIFFKEYMCTNLKVVQHQPPPCQHCRLLHPHGHPSANSLPSYNSSLVWTAGNFVSTAHTWNKNQHTLSLHQLSHLIEFFKNSQLMLVCFHIKVPYYYCKIIIFLWKSWFSWCTFLENMPKRDLFHQVKYATCKISKF